LQHDGAFFLDHSVHGETRVLLMQKASGLINMNVVASVLNKDYRNFLQNLMTLLRSADKPVKL